MSTTALPKLLSNTLPVAGDSRVIVGAVGLALLLVILVPLLRKRSKYASLPPAVVLTKAPPFVWRYYLELSKQYGPVFTLWEGPTPKVIVNDMASREFLMEKHARDTADRPEIMTVYGNGIRGLFVPYGEVWRNHRKALHTILQPSASKDYRPFQEKIARDVILDILAEPTKFSNHYETYNATMAQYLAYGKTSASRYTDPDIKAIIDIACTVGLFTKSNGLALESYPWLKYVPFYPGTKLMRDLDAVEIELYRKGIRELKERMAAGTQEPCFGTYLVENQHDLHLSDDEVANLAGTIFAAASDTTTSGLRTAVLAAAAFPEIQARVRAEIDAICPESPPTFADIEKPEDTPLLHAYIAELARWRPVNPAGFAHMTTSDIAYDNYVIPAGTSILGNMWAMSRDASYYGDNVEDFVIDRFITKDGKFNDKMKNVQFGFGRRACPGIHVASQSLKMNIALLFWSFKVGKKVVDGREVEVDQWAYTDTGTSHPLPFEVEFTARRENLASLMKDF